MKPIHPSSLTTVIRFGLIFVFTAALCISYAQVPKMTLYFEDMQAWGYTHWSYDLDAPGYVHGDSNPFTYNAAADPQWHTYAFNNFGVSGITVISCTQEDIGFINNAADISVYDYDTFVLKAYDKLNTAVPGGNWAAWGPGGTGGDERVYASTFHSIGDLASGKQLFLNNIQLDVVVAWPTQAEMRANLAAMGLPWSPGAAGWTFDVGEGGLIEGHGTADINLGSHADWLAALDNGTHQIEFTISTWGFRIQAGVGYYDMEVKIYPAAAPVNNAVPQVILANPFPQIVPVPQCDLDFNFNAAVGGGLGAENIININQVMGTPAGPVPLGIDHFCDRYWEIGTTLGAFNTSITFDMTGVALGDPLNWRICRKADPLAPWEIWPTFELVDANHIKANMVTNFSDWTVGTTEPDVLPVELSSFSAALTSDNYVKLNWVTQTETGLLGYNVYRAESPVQAEAELMISNVIPATNTSSTANYAYVDREVLLQHTYYYWLESVETDGSTNTFGPASVLVQGNTAPPLPETTYMKNAYPNPFHKNDRITIEVNLKAGDTGEVTVYNVAGQAVQTFKVNEGTNNLQWDGSDARGNKCGNGIYFYKLKTPSINQTRKMVIVN